MPRDSNGVYTLPPGNPVQDGTIIDVNWANPTMSDIALQLNNVITRDGTTAISTPWMLIDGTVPAPGLAFNSQPNLGLYREGANNMGVAAGGTAVAQFTSTEIVALKPLKLLDGSVAIGEAPNDGKQYARKSLAWTEVASGTGVFLPLAGGTMTGPILGQTTPGIPAFSFAGDPDTGLYNSAPNTIQFNAEGLMVAAMDTGGMTVQRGFKVVGGGTTVFSDVVAPAGGNAYLRLMGNANVGSVTSFDLIQGSDNQAYVWNRANGPLRFATNNAERLVITAAGVAQFIGNARFENIADFGTGFSGVYRIWHYAGAWYWRWNSQDGQLNWITTTGQVFTIDGSGNVTINGEFRGTNVFSSGAFYSTYAGGGLQVQSNIPSGNSWLTYQTLGNPNWAQMQFRCQHTSGQWAGFHMSGGGLALELILSGGGAGYGIYRGNFEQGSDERKKINILPANLADNPFMNINPITWEDPYTGPGPDVPDYFDYRRRLGFSAQNLLTVIPSAVKGNGTDTNPDGSPVVAAFDPIAILALAVLQIKNLVNRVTALETP